MARDKETSLQKARSLAKQLQYDFAKFELQHFIDHVEELTGSQIELFAWSMAPKVFGAWIKDIDQNTNLIFFDERAPRYQKRQIILHEVGHLLCGHSTLEIGTKDLNALLTAKLLKAKELEIFHAAQLRQHQGGFEDVEAEAFANEVQTKIRIAERPASKRVISKPLDDYLNSLGLK